MGPTATPPPCLAPGAPPALTGNTGSELVGELGEKVIVGSVLGGPKDDDGASIVNWGQKASSGGRLGRVRQGCSRDRAGAQQGPGLTFHLSHCLIAQNGVFST